MENQKTVHAIRGQGWATECTDEPPDHGKCVSSGQAFDVHGSGACARPRHYQPVPNQYKSGGSWVRGKRGYGLVVGRRESLFWDSRSDSFGGDILLGWHTTQKKEGWIRATRCMPWGIARENTHTVVDKNATMNKQTKQSSLFGNGEWHNQHK